MPEIGLGTSDPMHDIQTPRWLQGRFARIPRAIVFRIWRKWRAFKLTLSIATAIRSGYRLIDTSAAYGNERIIRRGIRWSRESRENLFIITRVSNKQQWTGDIREALLESLRNLGMDYVDMYMFHWPVPDTYIQTWREMEKLYREGLAKAIGVANCHQHHLEALLASATVIPAANEFESHPLMNQKALISFCTSKGISVIAYTPIGRFHEKLTSNDGLKSLSLKYQKSISQIILRWHYQRGIIAIPRSTSSRHIKSNIAIYDFELSKDEMVKIDDINENLRLRYDPDNCDFTKL